MLLIENRQIEVPCLVQRFILYPRSQNLQIPEVCIMNCSCADNRLVRSGLFSHDQKNIVVTKIAATEKEKLRPQILFDCPPFISLFMYTP